jgi:hypothetical protein
MGIRIRISVSYYDRARKGWCRVSHMNRIETAREEERHVTVIDKAQIAVEVTDVFSAMRFGFGYSSHGRDAVFQLRVSIQDADADA